MNVNFKLKFLGLLLLVISAKALIEIYFKNYVAISNIVFPIAVAVIIFEYEFGRKKEFDEKNEKIKTYNKIRELFRIADAYNLDNENELTYSNIKELLELFKNHKHNLTSEISNLWSNILKDEENKETIDDVVSSPLDSSDRAVLKESKKLLELVEKELKKLNEAS